MARLSLIVAISAVCLSSTAWPQESVDAQRCNGEIRASAQEQIASCSVLINSHSFSGKTLAIIYSNRGIIWFEQSEYYKAIVDFGEAIALDPVDFTSFYHRGQAKLKIGDAAGGKADIAKAKELNPEFRAPETATPSPVNAAALSKAVASKRPSNDKHSNKEVSHKRGKAERHEKAGEKVPERRHRREDSDAAVTAAPPSSGFAPSISVFGLGFGLGPVGARHW